MNETKCGYLDGELKRRYFRKMPRSSKYARALFSLHGPLLDVDNSFCKLTGYTKNELVHKRSFRDLTPADYRWYEAGMLGRMLRTGEPAIYEKEFLRRDDSRVPTSLTVFPVTEGGKRIAVAAVVEEVIVPRKPLETPRKSPPKHHYSVSSLPRTVFELDNDGRVMSINNMATRSPRYQQANAFLRLNIFKSLTPENKERLCEQIRSTLCGEAEGAREYTGLKRDGNLFPIIVHLAPILNGDRPVGLRGIAIDASDSTRRIQKTLEGWQHRYWDIFENSSAAILLCDLKGDIVKVNKAAATLTGYNLKELTGTSISRLFSDGNLIAAVKNQKTKITGENTTKQFKLEIVRKDGSRRAAESEIKCVAENGKPMGIQAVVREVADQKCFSENIQVNLGEIVKVQEEERKRLARELHDETAQSLASLLLDIEAVYRAREQSPQDVQRLLDGLRTSTNNILAGVRRFSYTLRPDILDQLGLVPALEVLANEIGVNARLATSVDVEGTERGLPAEKELALFRITQEALHNVAKHARANKVIVKLAFSDEMVVLTVADDGRGFEIPEQLEDLVAIGKLGLMSMYERALLVGGRLSIKSKPGGTTVVAELEC